MKRLFCSLFILILFYIAKSQDNIIQPIGDVDYSGYFAKCKDVNWQLTGIASNNKFTALFIRLEINTISRGYIQFPSSDYIFGDFGSSYPIALKIQDKDYPLNKRWMFSKWNKGKVIDCILYFNRIPAGVTKLSFHSSSFIIDDAPVTNNPNTAVLSDWTNDNLIQYWTENPCSKIEGIYFFTHTNKQDWWGNSKHTLAVKKDGISYKLIYLKGSNAAIWKEGEVKATFIPTASPGLYKATTWLMENKMENDNFYLRFEDGNMVVYENTNSVSATFLKLFPAVDINTTEQQIATNPSVIGANQSIKSTGSGIIIGSNVIATNYHVIDKAKTINVSVRNGKTVSSYAASVLCTDKINDLALLNIEDEHFQKVSEFPFSIIQKTKDVGASIFTMGYPLASYMGEEVKITDGIISSRTGYEGDIVTYQISAPIQPGSSGGPLFDKSGNLVGITNAGIKAAQNVGYAIKSSYLCNLIESAPVKIDIPDGKELENKDLTEQIKTLSKYVVFITITK